MGAIKDPTKVYETHKRRITKGKGNYSFEFVDYRCTVEYYVTHFLVHEDEEFNNIGHTFEFEPVSSRPSESKIKDITTTTNNSTNNKYKVNQICWFPFIAIVLLNYWQWVLENYIRNFPLPLKTIAAIVLLPKALHDAEK
ncbi:hypothetical protein G4B88_008814 [Cannabis sativa]|uniref:Uncharacterized protein n=1 Tax=Cannabis sativa TaxID=3483 RepID=A0A7J6DS17_CANSA|nr:hypothetical protein G4B88_008814 [Cannabis sativa]